MLASMKKPRKSGPFPEGTAPRAEKLDLFFSIRCSWSCTDRCLKRSCHRILCDHLGSPSQAVAVGDAENDIPMIRAAGIGVMCNGEAPPCLLRIM
ncbi:MAG: HAD hydrolase family protein [Blautia sp.]